jgi:hypothetical protein
MSQNSSDKYLYFTVGLLKNSSALEALRQDAVKHHMVDNPGQLIALRLTEYYEMMNEGIVQPVVRIPAVAISATENKPESKETAGPTAFTMNQMSPSATPNITPQAPKPSVSSQEMGNSSLIRQLTGKMRALQPNGETIISTSPDAEQNADEAADYWTML